MRVDVSPIQLKSTVVTPLMSPARYPDGDFTSVTFWPCWKSWAT